MLQKVLVGLDWVRVAEGQQQQRGAVCPCEYRSETYHLPRGVPVLRHRQAGRDAPAIRCVQLADSQKSLLLGAMENASRQCGRATSGV